MHVDKWFDEQTKLLKIILIIIPIVGWVVEVLVRISAIIRKPSGINIAGAIFYAVLGGFWVLCVIDVICLILNDRLLLTE